MGTTPVDCWSHHVRTPASHTTHDDLFVPFDAIIIDDDHASLDFSVHGFCQRRIHWDLHWCRALKACFHPNKLVV